MDFNFVQMDALRGRVGSLPAWGRILVGLAALPGIGLILLSILALAVSILALLLLTVPAYRIVRGIADAFRPREVVSDVEVVDPDGSFWASGTGAAAKRVEAKIVE